MAAADVAMWLAIKTKLGLADSSVTAEMKTNFLGAAKKEGFRCTAKVLKVGRRLIYGMVECVDSTGRLLAHSTVTYIRRLSTVDPGALARMRDPSSECLGYTSRWFERARTRAIRLPPLVPPGAQVRSTWLRLH